MQKMNYRLGDLELRTCNERLLSEAKEHKIAEIVKWEGRTCFVVAYWKPNSDHFDLHFVGDRPFKIEANTFWRLAKEGQKYLENTRR